MISEEIQLFRDKLLKDTENRDIRRKFHENYEWLESYWNQKFKGKNGEQLFCNNHDNYYWQFKEIKDIAKKFALKRPVGDPNNLFNPNENIKRATYYLKYNSELFKEREFDFVKEEKNTADNWDRSSFTSVFEIVKQIRNNLFHGRKIGLEPEPYDRNKELIKIAFEFTDVLLNKLVGAEKGSK